MWERYLRVIIMVLIMALGYTLREIQLFNRDDAKTISKIMMNLTLPATIITNLNGTRLTRDVLGSVILGFVINGLFFLVYLISSNKNDKDDQYVKLFCLCSFNIGSFTYPVMANFAPPLAQTAVLTFNYPGTAVFTYGVPVAVGKSLQNGTKGGGLKRTLNSMLHSVTSMSCFIMVLLCLLEISLPSFVIDFTSMISKANTALSMLCMGILLNLRISGRELVENIKVVLWRLGIATISALLIYFATPLSEEVRIALSITAFSPIAGAMSAQALHCGYEGNRVAIVNSIYLIISILAMSVLLGVLY